MEIRTATRDDVEQILELCRRFQASSGTIPRFDDRAMATTIYGLIFNQQNTLLVMADSERIAGAVGLISAPQYWTSELSATELFWYVDEDYRGKAGSVRLFRAAEAWAKEKGCVELLMGALATSPPHVRTIYERSGYTELQTSYVKRLE